MKNRLTGNLAVHICALVIIYINTANAQVLDIIDAYRNDVSNQYTTIHNPRSVYSGYGIYFDDADAKLNLVPTSSSDGGLRIEYELPKLYQWGNWLSVRREFKEPLDFSQKQGLKLTLKVEQASGAMLRITLSDVSNPRERHRDELWWHDVTESDLSKNIGTWITLSFPFSDFYKSHGAGTRHNNGQFDLSGIVAYEINLVTNGFVSETGVILVKSLATY